MSMFMMLCLCLHLCCLWLFMSPISKRYDNCVRRLILWLFCLWMAVALRLRADRIAHSNRPVGCDGNIFCLVAILLPTITYVYIFSLIVRSPGLLKCVAPIVQGSVVCIFYFVWVEVCNCVSQLHTLLCCLDFCCLSCCALWLRRGVLSPSQDYGEQFGCLW